MSRWHHVRKRNPKRRLVGQPIPAFFSTLLGIPPETWVLKPGRIRVTLMP